jgi:uncharacterized DUF497 family protein
MEIRDSARKHGISDADILHAVRNPIRYREQEYDGEARIFIIGADTQGRFLELVLVTADEPTRVIHADVLRPGHFDYLSIGVNTMTASATRDDADTFIASIDPPTMRDGAALRAITEAREAVTDSEHRLVEAIRAARAAGDSWTMIGLMLDTSRQNAHRKYAHLIGETT